jgi:hypothetical protein
MDAGEDRYGREVRLVGDLCGRYQRAEDSQELRGPPAPVPAPSEGAPDFIGDGLSASAWIEDAREQTDHDPNENATDRGRHKGHAFHPACSFG